MFYHPLIISQVYKPLVKRYMDLEEQITREQNKQ